MSDQMPATGGRFFLADPSLTAFSGHCFGYLSSLLPVLRARGYETAILGSLDVAQPLREQYGVIPTFLPGCDRAGLSWPQTRSIHERDLRDAMRRVTRSHRIGGNDVVLINTLRHWSLRGVVDWLEELPAHHRPLVALVLHFTSCQEPGVWSQAVDYYREAFHRIERSSACRRILLLADAEELIAEYRELNPNLTVRLAPIPHIRALPTPQADDAARRWRLGYAGEARLNKGFDLLPYLAERIAAAGLNNDVELHVHTFCGDPGQEFHARALCRLHQPFVVRYPDALDEEDYYRFVESIDLMLIPYSREHYHSQTSGIFAEAMGYGQVIVAPRGTWMARQLQRYGGGRTFIPGDAIDFAEQVLHVLSRRDVYRSEAASRADEWLRFHNPQHLVERIESALQGLAAA